MLNSELIKLNINKNKIKENRLMSSLEEKSESADGPVVEQSFTYIATNIINEIHKRKQKRDIWVESKWKHISELENDDVGKAGETIIHKLCNNASVEADIDGLKTKQVGGGEGDGTINQKTVEIKTARLSSNGVSFQHELGETPWKASFMVFLDIAPDKMYITIFPNFTEEFYKKSGCDSSVKCSHIFLVDLSLEKTKRQHLNWIQQLISMKKIKIHLSLIRILKILLCFMTIYHLLFRLKHICNL